ncbi:MAG: AzlD domain-containing protein [Pigmentiphaga sp.]|nr:AzlD domain-containing protein [Pigmentiphaga sp.]
MSETLHWWLAIATMGGITLALRAMPLLAHRWLAHSRILGRLNRTVPLCVMVVLLLVSLRGGAGASLTLLLEVVALGGVAVSYLRWRNPLLSVVGGIALLNGLQWTIAG